VPFKDTEIQKQWQRQYYQDHRQAALDYATNRNASHPEIRRAYRVMHHQEIIDSNRLSEKNIICRAVYRNGHRKEAVETSRQWAKNHPEQRKIAHSKSKAVRRTLGFIPVNLPFPGCEAHHLDHDRIVYIPSESHKSISHNGTTGRGMAQMNAIAYNFLFKQEVEHAIQSIEK
jgi:hypothetical protein